MIRFTKMHGLGNDFVVFDAVRQNFIPTPAQAKWIADRHFGIGCDQILVVERPQSANADFRYRIFNADGGEVEQCGNGARCFVRFVHEQGLTDKREIRVETLAGIITLRLEDDGEVRVNMGVPNFQPAAIPFLTDSEDLVQTLEFAGRSAQISAVSMGNPHAVPGRRKRRCRAGGARRSLDRSAPALSEARQCGFHGDRRPSSYPFARL
jgi:diaminopimelate epimerase